MSRTLEADDLMDELMHGEGILGTFFSMLWHKGAGKRTHQLWDIHIPDTIIYLYSKPLHWFFTSRAGEIKKKSRGRLNSKYIEEHFKRNGTSVSDIKAMYLEAVPIQPEEVRADAPVKISYCYSRDLRKFLQEDKPNGILQLFFDPKPEIGGGGCGGGEKQGSHVGSVRNSIVQTTWSPGCFFIEKRVNKHRLDNQKVDIGVRAATFDDYQNTETVPLVSDAVAASFQRICQMIADHISVVFRYKLASLVLNFKIDRNDTIWLLWCSSLRIVSEDKPVKALTATTAPPLQQYNREQQERREHTREARAAWNRRRKQLDSALESSQQWQKCSLSLREYPVSELCEVSVRTLMSALSGIDTATRDQESVAGVPTPILLLYPDMTPEEYRATAADPSFGERKVKVSRPCLDTLIKCASGIRPAAKKEVPAVIRDLDSSRAASVLSRRLRGGLGPESFRSASTDQHNPADRAVSAPPRLLPPIDSPPGPGAQSVLEYYQYDTRGFAKKLGYAQPVDERGAVKDSPAVVGGVRVGTVAAVLEKRQHIEPRALLPYTGDGVLTPAPSPKF